MTSTLCEQAIDQLGGWVDELPAGTRLMITTSEPCGCDNTPLSRHQSACHLCNGAGVLIDAKTFRGEPREAV